MAFTDAQKVKILRYLGWPIRSGWMSNDTFLTALAEIEATPSAETEITALLARLDYIDAQAGTGKLSDALDNVDVSSLGRDDVVLNPSEILRLRMEGRRLSGQLAYLTGLELLNQGGFGGNDLCVPYENYTG